MAKEQHPMQPVVIDKDGTPRFKKNAIVRFLLDSGGFDMNSLSSMPFCEDDWEQFAQLIGYSVSGFGDLSYVSDEAYERASSMVYADTTEDTIKPQGTESRVCDDICQRQALGINKYGGTVEQNSASLREWLQHAYEEALDLAIYLKRAIEETEKGM